MDPQEALQKEMDEMDAIVASTAQDDPFVLGEETEPETESDTGVEDTTPETEIDAGVEDNAPVTESDTGESAEPTETDEYDFSLLNEMARQALGSAVGSPPSTPAPTESVPQPAATPETPPPASTSPSASLPAIPALGQLVSLEEMQQAFESPEKMVELWHKSMEAVATKVRADATREALMMLPQVARTVSMQAIKQAELARNFYKDNPELASCKDFVQYVAHQVETTHPDWSMEQVVEETAKVAKKKLPLFTQAKRNTPVSAPALPANQGQRRTRGERQKLSALDEELAAMPEFGSYRR